LGGKRKSRKKNEVNVKEKGGKSKGRGEMELKN
jgi:hypothetical protein